MHTVRLWLRWHYSENSVDGNCVGYILRKRSRPFSLKNTGIGAARSRAYEALYTIQPREFAIRADRGVVARMARGMNGRVR